MRTIGRALAAGLLGAFAGVTWLALFYAWSPALRFDFDVTPPSSVIDGVYPPERDPDTGTTFAWTGETLSLTLPDLDRKTDWTMELRARSARSAGVANPDLTFFVDGVLALSKPAPNDYEVIQVPVAARPARSGVLISMRVTPT